MLELDRRSTPSVMVATSAFVSAVEARFDIVGFEAAVVYVEHPLANRTPEELDAMADGALGEILSRLTVERG